MEGVLAGIIQNVINPVLHQKAEVRPQYNLLDEIESVKHDLDSAFSKFDYQNDPDLTESCIYELQALTARYRYLLREARREGLTKEVCVIKPEEGMNLYSRLYK